MSHWIKTKDGDPLAAALYRRHYSCYQYADNRRDDPAYRNRNLIVGPGEKLILVTPDYTALFIWRRFIDKSGQTGVNCAAFRNESTTLASELIKDACAWAWQRWPGQRLYTYVDASAIKSSNPGYCFRLAGWRRCGVTKKRKLIILELYPEEVNLTTPARRNPLAAQTDITLATETSSPQLIELLPSQIHIDAGLQTRDKMSQETITEYAEAMANGDQFPPLTVFHNGDTHALVKGFHRLRAHIMAFGEDKPIRCKTVYGNRRDALKEALGDNADHGLRLTREDKRKKVKIALADAEWGQWSDREIAKLCKVSHPLVAEVRREVTGNSSSDQPRTYTTKHGTQATMHTERISQANSARSSNATSNDDAMPYAAIIEQIAATEPDALQSPPQSLMIDESLAIILDVAKATAASPALQLAWLRVCNRKEAFLYALQPGTTFNNYCFNQAHQQAIVLIEAEAAKAAKTTQEAPTHPPAPSLTPPAAPTPQPAPVAPAGSGKTSPSRTERIVELRRLCQSLIDSLPDYGELTGDYSSTLALRRALEPMIRKLEENSI